MDRRTLLTTLGGATVTGLAGCLEGSQSSQNPTQKPGGSNDDNQPSENPTEQSSGSSDDSSITTADSSTPDVKTGLEVGQKPPDFSLQTTAGTEVSLYPVEKPTALFFMAAWCLSCKQEEANLKQIHETFGDDIQLMSIEMDPDRDSMKDLQNFKKQYGGDWIHAMGTQEFIQTYRLTSLDTTYIINQNGVTTYKDSDVTSVTKYKNEFEKLL